MRGLLLLLLLLLDVKYDNNNNQPRIDVVIWILISRVTPDILNRMTATRNAQSRKHRASWRMILRVEGAEGHDGGPVNL
jgi:hypothetical protein